jgi:hypothetical protein
MMLTKRRWRFQPTDMPPSSSSCRAHRVNDDVGFMSWVRFKPVVIRWPDLEPLVSRPRRLSLLHGRHLSIHPSIRPSVLLLIAMFLRIFGALRKHPLAEKEESLSPASFSPLANLTDDLLVQVFAFLAPHASASLSSDMLVGFQESVLVCRRWKKISLRTDILASSSGDSRENCHITQTGEQQCAAAFLWLSPTCHGAPAA